MGQKVHPTGFRVGTLYQWSSRWFSQGANYRRQVMEDMMIRDFLSKRLENAGVTNIEIERSINKINIVLSVARPGVVIGRGGATLKELQTDLAKRLSNNPAYPKGMNVGLEVLQVEQPDLEARLVAKRVSEQLVNRYPHRRAVGQALERVKQAGAKGVKIQLSGRIAGAEIGRQETYSDGTIPTQTLRNDISYAHVPALTKSGYVGVKVWINRGEKEI